MFEYIISQKIFISSKEVIGTCFYEDDVLSIIESKRKTLSADLKKVINIIRAFDGLEAIEICKANLEIDLVLMDIKMPKLDGYEATKQIKKIRPDLPIIVQTAYTTDLDKNKAYAAGCSYFVSKPIDRKLLLTIINEIFLKR